MPFRTIPLKPESSVCPLTRLFAESGDLDQAIRWQEEAVKFSEGNDKAIVEEIKQTLDTYKSSNAP